jgi:hypothetical protein
MAPAILFFVAAAFWAGIVLLGGGVYLTWAAATGLLSGALLVALPSNRATNPLVVASALFGILLTLYQLYLGLTLIGTVLNTVAIYNTVPFAIFTVLYAYLLLFTRPAQKTSP